MESPQAASHEEEDRHEDNMSPVVQNLEHVAISDPAYANGRTRNSQNQVSQIPQPVASHLAASPAPPSQASSVGRSGSVNSAAAYTPMAYNPAAPPAPEPIAHREKTPPPVDAVEGTGLAAAAVADHAPAYGAPQAQPYSGLPQTQPYTGVPQTQPYTGVPQAQPYTGVPGSVPTTYGYHGSPPPPAYGSPPAQQALGHNPSISSTGSLQRASTASPYAPPPSSVASPRSGYDVAAAVTGHSFAPPPRDPNAHTYGSVGTAPMQSPGAQIYGSSHYGQSHQPLQHIQPQYPDYLSSKTQPPPGGYSQYSYDQQPQRRDSGSTYDVHSQVYRPTEAEATKPTRKASTKPSDKPFDGGYQSGKLEQRADRVEKGVNKYLKKLEKKLG